MALARGVPVSFRCAPGCFDTLAKSRPKRVARIASSAPPPSLSASATFGFLMLNLLQILKQMRECFVLFVDHGLQIIGAVVGDPDPDRV